MEFNRNRDAILVFAIIASLALGLLSLYGSFVVAMSIGLRTGILKLHFFEPPAPHPDEGLVFLGVVLLAVSIAVVITVATSRSIMRFGEARSRDERQ